MSKTLYQFSKTFCLTAERYAQRGGRLDEYRGKFLVVTDPIDSRGNFIFQPLKSRGYKFNPDNGGFVDGLRLLGKVWFKVFDSEALAQEEIDQLCEVGI